VIAVDRDGQVAWQIEQVPHCYGARRLRDGSTAVMQQQQNLVRIYDPAGKAIEDVKLSRSSSDWVPLPDGSMQCGHRFVRRCDKDGNEIWKVDVGGWVGRVTLR
jgi:hypothetical protein